METLDPPAARRAPLLLPLNLAGFATWLVVVLDQLFIGGRQADAWPSVQLAALFAFGLLFVLRASERLGRRGLAPSLLVLAMTVLALANNAAQATSSAPALLVIGIAQAPATMGRGWARALTAAASVALWLIIDWRWQASHPLQVALSLAGFNVFALFAAQMADDAERARDALARVNAELLATRSLLEAGARDGERLRLSRELHDLAGHSLTALRMSLELALRVAPQEREARVRAGLQLTDQLLADIRGVVGQMRASDGIEFEPALRTLVERTPGLDVRLSVAPALRLARVEQAETLLRCVQEALTNAMRHAHARTVHIALRRDGDEVIVDIRDDGRGHAQPVAGNGLTGMRERVEALGGALRWVSAAGEGFALQLRWPA